MSISPRTYIELSKEALFYNIEVIKKCIGNTQLAVVVKSNAYGHSMLEVAKLCQENNSVQWLCTAGLSESLLLRKNGINKPVIALSYLDADFTEAINENIHCAITCYEDVLALNEAAIICGKKAFVHLKIDTGMARLGILPNKIIEFINSISQLPGIYIYGIFTHLCDAANINPEYSYLQLKKFDAVLDELKNYNISIPCTHIQSSSGLSVAPVRKYTLMRAGAAIYGIYKSMEHKQLITNIHPEFNLKQILTWKTKIIQIKSIAAGSYVGYDRTYITKRAARVAILPIGYWDGYNRKLSNKGQVYINGHYAPVIGIVSMNLMCVDITNIDNVKLNDEVILTSDITGITAHEIAHQAGIITNEFVTNINSNIKRSVVETQFSIGIADTSENQIFDNAQI